MLILGIRLASDVVDAVKSVGLGLGCLWRILVSQRLEPTHNVISDSDPDEAIDRIRTAAQIRYEMAHTLKEIIAFRN